MASESNNSAILDVIAVNKEMPSLKDTIEIEPHRLYCNSNYENSLDQSPSVDSFSTLHDVENLSELNMDGNSDICVKIDNPQKHLETLETYITFRIITKVAKIEFSENEYLVHRRYNDFCWLRQKLVESHPFCIVPPLPGKHSLIGQLDRYSKDFILQRMQALNLFIMRVCQHPILSCSEHFKVFLTAEQADFTLHRKQRYPIEYKILNLRHSTSPQGALSRFNEEFEKTKSFLTILSEKLTCFEKMSSRINKERTEYISELNNYHPIFSSWANNEPDLTVLLQLIGSALERSAVVQTTSVHSYGNMIGNPVKDLLSYIDVVQETIKKRESYQCAYESSLDELNRRHAEKNKLMALSHKPSNSSTVSFSLWKSSNNDDKLEKLGTYIPQLMKKVETHQDKLECANESLRSDLERWHLEKRHNLEKILTDFVNKEIKYYQASLDAWQSVSDYLNERKDESLTNGSE